MSGLFNKGVCVPEDVSAIGFDDLKMSQYLTPELTTIRRQISLKVQKAVKLLLDVIGNPDLSKREDILP